MVREEIAVAAKEDLAVEYRMLLLYRRLIDKEDGYSDVEIPEVKRVVHSQDGSAVAWC